MKTLYIAILAVLVPLGAWAQTNLTGTLRIWLDWTHTKTAGAAVVTEKIGKIINDALTTGTNANQMTAFVRQVVTLTNAETITLDLLGGVENSFGDAITFDRINFMGIVSQTNSIDPLVVGNAASNQFSTWLGATNQTATVLPGGCVLAYAPDAAGYAIGSGTNLLKFTNGGTNDITLELYIGGTE